MKIEIKLDKKKKTLQVIDSGIGMTDEEIRKYYPIRSPSQVPRNSSTSSKTYRPISLGILDWVFTLPLWWRIRLRLIRFPILRMPSLPFGNAMQSTDYTLSKGKRKEIGTTITIYLNEESEEYNEEAKIREILEKYCNFMPYPILFEDKEINQKEALWNRKPTEVKPEEYTEFYQKCSTITLIRSFGYTTMWISLSI
jgi:molecular chaperone HtpG